MPAKRKTTTRGKSTKKTVKKAIRTTKKAAPRKAAAKKATTRKAIPKKAAPKKIVAKKLTPVRTAFTKAQVLTEVADSTDLSKKEVTAVLERLSDIMEAHLRKRGCGEFSLPGLMKCKVVRKPATKARKGINPFTGEETMFKAKPARNVIKVRPLKKLKEMAEK